LSCESGYAADFIGVCESRRGQLIEISFCVLRRFSSVHEP
jgi:hypothetical protein